MVRISTVSEVPATGRTAKPRASTDGFGKYEAAAGFSIATLIYCLPIAVMMQVSARVLCVFHIPTFEILEVREATHAACALLAGWSAR